MSRIRVGTPHATPDMPAHTKGVRQGNEKNAYRRQVGHRPDGTADARRSTGVNPKHHNPILPVMPSLPPG
jgi:hypothetical protein